MPCRSHVVLMIEAHCKCFPSAYFCLQDEVECFLFVLILCLSICNNSNGFNKVCFVDLVLLSCNHILFMPLLSSSTSEESREGSTATAARLCVCACVNQLTLPPPPSVLFFFFFNFIHKMQQHHSTIFTLASCC